MLDKKTMVPCVDWFRGIVPMNDVREFCAELAKIDDRLRFENFVYDGRSMLNYTRRYCHIDVPSLTFAFNPIEECGDLSLIADPNSNNKHILFSLSGDAIRYLGHESLRTLLYWLYIADTKCTRLDLALDFFDASNDVIPMILEGCGNFIGPKNKDLTVHGLLKRDPVNWKCFINRYKDGTQSYGYNIGNHGSEHGMFRVYDKKYETLYGRNRSLASDLLGDRDYWYRAELELHNGRSVDWAGQALKYLVDSDFNVYAVFGQCLSEFISFKYVKYACTGTYEDCETWDAFIYELTSCIHFVQLVKEKFVPRDLEYHWAQASHYSVMLSAFLDLSRSNPSRFWKLIKDGRERRQTQGDKRLRYSAIEELYNKLG
jgi:hypothetical protein